MNHKTILLLTLAFFIAPSVYAYPLSVSQFGYHTNSYKGVIFYTNQTSGILSLVNSTNNQTVALYPLVKAKDAFGYDTECQGNIICLIADFSSFKSPGQFYATADSYTTRNFTIDDNRFKDTISILLEFFDATLQQNSSYKKDLHSKNAPIFPFMADGSFIMEADQAASTLIRLGSAYRRNPLLFTDDNHNISKSETKDILEYMHRLVEYLKGLQGAEIEERNDGTGFRLNPGLKVNSAFVPGPTNLTTLDVFIPGEPPTLLETVLVVSLCGDDNSTLEWNSCIDTAAAFYKCQIGEACLDMSYIEKTGILKSNNNGHKISRGWSYEFGCFNDILFDDEQFTDTFNPCQIFYNDTTRAYTVQTLLAFLEAYPAIYDYDSALGNELLVRSLMTYSEIKDNFPAFNPTDSDAGFFGAALFLLYDYTGNVSHLYEAHSLRNHVSANIISNHVSGPEIYWDEFVRHKTNILNHTLNYSVKGAAPEEFFRGKMFFDYKDSGPLAISKTAERVFQFDPNIKFQNSRYMLAEGVIAAKTVDMLTSPEDFIKEIADYQLAWLTGANAVQDGVSLNSTLISKSFIFGIGQNPNEFHSRLLIDTGYTSASGGQIAGARGTDLQFYNGSDYIYLDAKFKILNSTLGSLGNGYNNEAKVYPFVKNQAFNNGKNYIPGWISGVFDIFEDSDMIFNFNDDLDIYQYTETTNEMVATAIELWAYLDAQHNNKSRHTSYEVLEKSAALTVNKIVINNNTGTKSLGDFTLYINESTVLNGEPNYLAPGIYMVGEAYDSGYNLTFSGDCDKKGFVNLSFKQKKTCNITNDDLDVSQTNETICHTNLENIEAACHGGMIITDTYNGCRSIKCKNATDSIDVLACDKPDSSAPTHFEMYKQGSTGSPLKLCLGDSCVQYNGYSKSAGYPLCVNATVFANDTSSPKTIYNATLKVTKIVVNDDDGYLSMSNFPLFVNGTLVISGNANTLAPGSYLVSEISNSNYTSKFSGDCDSNGVIVLSQNDSKACTITNDDVKINSTTCFSNLENFPATCNGGAITQDTYNGCRNIICKDGMNNLTVLACDKPDTVNPTHFEMYLKEASGFVPKICLGDACVQYNGYSKSAGYKICIS